jgi:hypothetical protein
VEIQALGPVAAEAMFFFDLESAFRRLPASARAKITWTKPKIDAGLTRLLAEPVSDAVLDEVVSDLNSAIHAVSRTFFDWFASNPDGVRASLMADLRIQEECLRTFLPDDDSRDTLNWVLGVLRHFFTVAFAFIPPEQRPAFDDAELAQVSSEPGFRSMMRALVALMAAFDGAQRQLSSSQCAELLDAAFLNLVDFSKAARRDGLWFAPFPNETLDERRESLQRYASRLRETLTADDWTTLDDARMSNLR